MRAHPAALWIALCTLAACTVACSAVSTGAPPELPIPRDGFAGAKNPIRHVVIAIEENRSFDDFFATFPGADGTTTGKAAAMPPVIAQSCSAPITKPTTIPLKEVSLVGDGNDLDHNHAAFGISWNHGAMDGFDLIHIGAGGDGPPACRYPYQYVNPKEIAPYWELARQYVLADHTFQTQGSGSFTAHQDLIAGGTRNFGERGVDRYADFLSVGL